MRKLFLLTVLCASILHINAGLLSLSPNNDVPADCKDAKMTATFTINCYSADMTLYRIYLPNNIQHINNATISMVGPDHENYEINGELPLIAGYFNAIQGDNFTVTVEASVDEIGVYNIPVIIENSSKTENYETNCVLQATHDCNIPVGFFGPNQINLEREYYYDTSSNMHIAQWANNSIELLAGKDYYFEASVESSTGSFASDPFEWELTLLHSNGKDTIDNTQSTGMYYTTAQLTTPSTLPNYKWCRDNNNNIIGEVSVSIDDASFPQRKAVRISMPFSPNKGIVYSTESSGKTQLLTFDAFGAEKYNVRYKSISESTWTYRNNYNGNIWYSSFLPGEHYFQVQGINDEGTGPWSDSYIIYSERTAPFHLSSTNTNMSNDWDVESVDGADRTFKFNLPNRATIIASTDFAGTDFDTKLEIFDHNRQSTNDYNDDCDGDHYDGYTSKIITTLDAGIYYLVVDGYSGETGNFEVSLDVEETIYTLPFSITDSNVGANNNFNVNGSDGADVAYKFYLPNDASINISTCFSSTDYDTKIEVFNTDGTTTSLYNDDDDYGCNENDYASSIYGGNLSSGTYYLVVDGYAGDQGDFTVEVTPAITSKSASIGIEKSTYSKLSDTDDLGKYKLDKNELIEQIRLYPNPATNHVKLESPYEVNYQIYDASGRAVTGISESQKQHAINTNKLNAGIYLISITGNGQTSYQKLTIKN